jgi:hypothetical protein
LKFSGCPYPRRRALRPGAMTMRVAMRAEDHRRIRPVMV